MLKFVKFIWSTALVIALFCFGILLVDKASLRNDILRLHVVGASNERSDQENKLVVRDAVLSYLEQNMPPVDSAEAAAEFISGKLDEIRMAGNTALNGLGCNDRVTVKLLEEEFTEREYDTFSLPSGVYNALRVEIGEASGENWWCVVFPALCSGTTVDVFMDDAVEGGLDAGLADSLCSDGGVNIRFFLLDCIGKLENLLHFE